MMCSGPENPLRASNALSAPMRPAHGSTVFFMLVSFPAQTFAFTEREWGRDEIARMTRVRFPIDVVVVHRADHVTIQKRGIDRIGLEAGNECRGFAVAIAQRAVMLEQNFRVLLLTTTQRA